MKTQTHSSGNANSRQLKDDKLRKRWGKEGRKEERKKGRGEVGTYRGASPLFCYPRLRCRLSIKSKGRMTFEIPSRRVAFALRVGVVDDCCRAVRIF